MKEIDSFLKEHDKNLQEVEEARKDYRGNINKSLEDRLNADQDDIYNRFNIATLLPYSDQYITAENSYKGRTRDLMLKGRTLHNVAKFKSSLRCTINGNEVTVDSEQGKVYSNYISDATILKKNTEYTLVINIIENTLEGTFFAIAGGENQIVTQTTSINYFKVPSKFVGLYVKKFTIRDDVQALDYTIQIKDATSGQIKYIKPIILEGDWSNKPIPNYFEEIRSVCESGEGLVLNSCGKNIANPQSYLQLGFKTGSSGEPIEIYSDTRVMVKLKVQKGIRYTINTNSQDILIRDVADSTKYLATALSTNFYSFISKDGIIRIAFFKKNLANLSTSELSLSNVQIEEGTTATQYEPYTEDKTDSLKDLNLRGLDLNVRDTLDSKGALTRNIAKTVLNGTETNWQVYNASLNNVIAFVTKINPIAKDFSNIISDKFIYLSENEDIEHIRFSTNGNIIVYINKSKLVTQDINGFKAWLKDNPVTVYYQLATPTTETIQGMKELNTYDKVTHIFQEGTSVLQGDIECKVPSNVQATIATLKLENKALAVENTALKNSAEDNTLTSIETSINQEERLTMLEMGVK